MSKRLAQIEFALAAALLAAIVLLVFVAAILRFFDHPLIWSVDMAQLLFIWLCFIGATRAMREKGHIGIDLLVRTFPFRWRLTIETAVSLVILAFLVVLTVEGYKLTVLNHQRQFGDSGLSYAWVTIAVPAGSLMLGAAIIRNMVMAWRRRMAADTLVYSRVTVEPAPASEL